MSEEILLTRNGQTNNQPYGGPESNDHGMIDCYEGLELLKTKWGEVNIKGQDLCRDESWQVSNKEGACFTGPTLEEVVQESLEYCGITVEGKRVA